MILAQGSSSFPRAGGDPEVPTMSIIINKKPDNDFKNPLGLMSDCHRRIERFLNQLIEITDMARGGELWPAQKEALGASLRYFRAALKLPRDRKHGGEGKT